MKITQKKLQKAMDKYYYKSNRINVDQIDDHAPEVQGLNGHHIQSQVFSINSPYVDTMNEPISLTLYYDTDTKTFILSDDGISYSSAITGKLHLTKSFKNYIHDKISQMPVQNCKLYFYKQNQSFQASFNNISQITDAYHALIQIIIMFQSIADYRSKKV